MSLTLRQKRLYFYFEEDGIRGMTSSPGIFEKTIAGSHDYDEDIRVQVLRGKAVETIYESVTRNVR